MLPEDLGCQDNMILYMKGKLQAFGVRTTEGHVWKYSSIELTDSRRDRTK